MSRTVTSRTRNVDRRQPATLSRDHPPLRQPVMCSDLLRISRGPSRPSRSCHQGRREPNPRWSSGATSPQQATPCRGPRPAGIVRRRPAGTSRRAYRARSMPRPKRPVVPTLQEGTPKLSVRRIAVTEARAHAKASTDPYRTRANRRCHRRQLRAMVSRRPSCCRRHGCAASAARGIRRGARDRGVRVPGYGRGASRRRRCGAAARLGRDSRLNRHSRFYRDPRLNRGTGCSRHQRCCGRHQRARACTARSGGKHFNECRHSECRTADACCAGHRLRTAGLGGNALSGAQRGPDGRGKWHRTNSDPPPVRAGVIECGTVCGRSCTGRRR